MSKSITSIKFNLVYKDEIIQIDTNPYEYENLMELIQNKIVLDEFGECLGMGKCCTCLVNISSFAAFPEKERNEESTLLKNGIVDKPTMRLSCQIEIGDHLNDAVISIVSEL